VRPGDLNLRPHFPLDTWYGRSTCPKSASSFLPLRRPPRPPQLPGSDRGRQDGGGGQDPARTAL